MNVIVIYTDDQGYGDASCLNKNSKFETVNIDKLASEGISFTDAHCSSAVCTPSRYGILTGRYNWRTRLKSGVMLADEPCLIDEGRSTVASLFQRNGYHTMMIGKWHLGMEFAGEFGDRDWDAEIKGGPADHGFDYFYGIPASMNFGVLTYIENKMVTEPASVFTAKKPTNVAISDFHFAPPYEKTKELDHCEYLEAPIEIAPSFKDEDALQILADKALQKIRNSAMEDKPFFLYLALNSPHKPVCPSKAFWGKSDAGRYGDFMLETDYHVGRIIDCVNELEIEDDTMIIFTSDNGAESTYVKRKEKFGHDSSGGLRGGKRDLYEGGHRVPFIIKYPKLIKAGTICAEPICQTDLFDTFAQLIGDTKKDNEAEDSVSLVPIFEGNYETGYRGSIVNHSATGHFGIRDGKWKLCMIDEETKEHRPVLFNLETDIMETTDLSAQHPEIVKNLTEKLTEFVCMGRSTKGVAQSNDINAWWPQLTWLSEEAVANYSK